jgi:hypothetical protein
MSSFLNLNLKTVKNHNIDAHYYTMAAARLQHFGHCRKQHKYVKLLPISVYFFNTSIRTGTVPAVSLAVSALRKKGTVAPYLRATSAISLSSVETMTSSKMLDAKAASIEYAIIGFPIKSFMFFLGILLLPPRAGIIAIQLIFRPISIHISKRSTFLEMPP